MAPFPARHTGKNISLGLDAMLEDLQLDSEDWELFAVSDNAANAKLGVKLSRHLKQYLCSIHTLELGVKDTFKKTPGMQAVLTITKAMGKFTHQSTVATAELKKEAEKEGIKFRKIANPPNTRWSGRYSNLKSVLHLKKPLLTLAATYENWSEHALTAAQWKLVEGAVKMLKPVKDTIKVWETETEPTMQAVIEQLYILHDSIDTFIRDKENTKYGIGFAKELKSQVEKRFPNKGGDDKIRRMANLLNPHLKGLHLEDMELVEETKKDIEMEVKKMESNQKENSVEEEVIEEDTTPLSPNSKLRKKLQSKQNMQSKQQTNYTQFRGQSNTPLEKEFVSYMKQYSFSKKGHSILNWWRKHEKVLPLLSKVAKKVLSIPASSSKSERVFSCGGNFVSKKRNKLAPKKVEDLIIIKENKTRIQAFKAKETYELKPVEKTLSIKVSVDEIIANLDKDSDDDEVFDHDDDNCEVLFYINEEDSDTDSEEEAYLEEVLD